MSTITAWSVNLEVEPADPEYNGQRIQWWIAAAVATRSSDKPHFILFPEMCISGYVRDREVLQNIRSGVEEVQQAIQDASCKLSNTALVVGHPYYSDNAIYIRQSVIRTGKVIFHHDKIKLSPREEEVFLPGTSVQTFSVKSDTDEVTCGILLCYETHFPELAQQLARQQCDILFMPFASPRERPKEKYIRFLRFLPARAYDNSMVVLTCNLIQQFPKTGPSPGVAMLISPRGELLTRKVGRRESVLKARIDLEKLRHDLPRFVCELSQTEEL